MNNAFRWVQEHPELAPYQRKVRGNRKILGKSPKPNAVPAILLRGRGRRAYRTIL